MVRKASMIMPPDTDAQKVQELRTEFNEALNELKEYERERRQLEQSYKKQSKALDKLLASTQRKVEKLQKHLLKLGG